ncbi:MAG: hemolysin family protein, partial [Chloroflexota bacterium]|nr:hemolysin family protein [Chloroflexota bacterium]
LALARPVEVLGIVLSPVVWFLTTVTHGITRLLGVRDVPDEAITSQELRILVERGSEQGTIEAEEEQMIGGVLELGEQRAHEVMVARVDMVSLEADASLGEIIQTIVGEGHSRIPVYEENIDNVIGMLYAKDLLPYLVGEDRPPSIRRLLRTPLFVPESMLVDDLLRSLQRRRVHIAIVLDEHGGTAGLVTIEDLLEEIVGEIQDEYDEEEPMIVPLGDHEARIDGRADVDDMLEHFDTTLEGDDQDEFDTVGGLVYHHIGGVPKVGDEVSVDGLKLTVEATDGRRVRTVHVVHTPPAADEDEQSDD